MSSRSELRVTVRSSPQRGEVLTSARYTAVAWSLEEMEVEHS
jgi:hypothetical protein